MKIRKEPDPLWMELAQILRERRRYLGLDQRVIAEKVGVSQSALGYWEVGRTIPNTVNCIRWCEALGLDLWPMRPGDL